MENDPAVSKLLNIFKSNPTDLETFEELQEYYFISQQWNELTEVLEIRANAILDKSPQEASKLYFKQGEYLEKKIGDAKKALPAYEKAYANCDDDSYFNALIHLGESIENWQVVVETLQMKLDRSREVYEKSALLVQMAQYMKAYFDDIEQTEMLLMQAVEVDETNEQAVSHLEKLYMDNEAWQSLIELNQIQYRRAKTSQEKIRKLKQCAQIYEEELENTTKAIEFYEEILQLDPSNMNILSSLEYLFSSIEQWDKVISVMEKQLQFTEQPEERSKLLSSIAIIWSEKVKDLDKAVECYERALIIQEDEMILQILEETYRFQEKWENLAGIYEKQTKFTKTSEQKVTLFCSLGELYDTKLQNKQEAISWYNKAFENAPRDFSILKKLQELYQEQGDIENTFAFYRKELDFVSEKSDKLEIYEHITTLLMENNYREESAEIYEEILSLYPDQKDAFQRLADIYKKLELPEKLLHTFIRESEHSDRDEKIELYKKIASLLTKKLERETEAVSYYQKILVIDEKNIDVLKILKKYYTKQNSYQSLIEIIYKIMEVNSFRVVPGYLEIAKIQRENLKDFSGAIKSYKEVLKITPKYLDAWKSLRDLYKEKKQWRDYVSASKKVLELVPGNEEKIEIHYSLADIYLDEPKYDKVESHLKAILNLKADEFKAIDTLKEIYLKQKLWEKYVDILQDELKVFTGTSEEMSDKCEYIAQIYHKELENIEKGIVYYERARLYDPANKELLDVLEDCYRNQKDFANLAKIYEIHAIIEVSKKTNTYLYKAAKIYEAKLNAPQKAIKLYDKVLENNPKHEEAATKLEELLLNIKDYKTLATFYNKQAKLAKEKDKCIEIHFTAGNFGEDYLEDTSYAISHYESILHLEVEHKETVEKLINIYRLEENWAKLAELYEIKLKISQDKEDTIEILQEQAFLYNQVDEPFKAAKSYNKILKVDAKNFKAITALEELCRERELWVRLIETLEKKVKLLERLEEKLEVCKEIGALCFHKTFEYQKAIQYYQQSTKIDSDDFESWECLHKLYKKINDFDELENVILQKLEMVEEESQITLLFELAELYEKRLDNVEEAIASYDRILLLDENNMNAFNALAKIYRQKDDKDNLLDVWKRQVQSMTPENQKILLLKIGHLLEEKGDIDLAIETLEETLQIAPDYQHAKDFLIRLYNAEKKWDSLIAFYEKELGEVEEEKAAPLFQALGAVLEITQQYEDALYAYKSCLETASDNLSVIKSMQRIYDNEGNLPELVEMYHKEIEIESIDSNRRVSLLIKSAQILELEIQDSNRALENYSYVMELDPKNIVAVRGLERIYEENKEYNSLLAALKTELGLQEEPKRVAEIQTHIAILQEEKFDDLEQALDFFLQVHNTKPEDLFIIGRIKHITKTTENWEVYVDMLEKEIALVEDEQDTTARRRELMVLYEEYEDKAIYHGQEILKVHPKHLDTLVHLQTFYKKTQNVESLLEVSLKEYEIQEECSNKSRLEHLALEIGLLYKDFEDYASSVLYLEKSLDCNPLNEKALNTIVELYTNLEKWEKLIDIYSLTSSLSQNQEEIENLNIKIAQIYDKKFSDYENALFHYEHVSFLNAENLVAIKGMKICLEALERWGELIEAIEAESKLHEEKKRPTLYLSIGDIWNDKLGQPRQAIASYQRVMEHGFHRETAEKIMVLQEKIHDYKGLAEILEKDIRVTKLESDEIVKKLCKLGKIYKEHLHATEEAIRVFKALLKLNQQHMEALTNMEELLTSTNEWKALIGIKKQKLKVIEDDQVKFQVCCEIAQLYNLKRDQGLKSIDYYEKALGLVGDDLETIHTLEILYDNWGEYNKLIRLYQKEIQLIENEERINELYHLIGKLWSDRLFDGYNAIDNYCKLLKVSPHDEKALVKISQLYRYYEYWTDLVEILKIRIERATEQDDIELEINLCMELGNLYKEHIGDIEAATSYFQRILELEEFHEGAFAALETLYEKKHSFNDMVEVLEEKSRLVTDPQALLSIYLRLGKLYEENLEDWDKAIENYQKAISISEENIIALKALHRLYHAKKDWDPLADIVEKEIEVIDSIHEQVELCYLLGNIQLEHFESVENASECFKGAIELNEKHIPSLEKMIDISYGIEDWEATKHYILESIQYVKHPLKKSQLFIRLGKLYDDKFALEEEALEMYHQALKMQPDSLEALRAITDIYFQNSDWELLEPLQEKLIAVIPEESEELHIAYYRWGCTAQALGHEDQALARYLETLKLNEKHLRSLLAVGDIYLNNENWNDALAIFKQLYELEELEDKSDVLYKMALSEDPLGYSEQAIIHYEQLLEIEPGRLDVIEALARLHKETENYEQSFNYYEILSQSKLPVEKVYNFIQEQGYVLSQMGENQRAVDKYLQVLEFKQDSSIVFTALVDLYIKLEDWENALKYNQHYFEIADDKVRLENRCKRATILLDGLKDSDAAIAAYKEAMEIEPTYLRAMKGIVKIHITNKNWELLAEHYVNFLNSLPVKKKEVAFPIYFALGHLLADKLGDRDSAISAFESALELEPNHIEAYTALVELKTKSDAYREDAVKGHLSLLRRQQFRSASYRALYHLLKVSDKDKALRAYRALSLIEKDNKDEDIFQHPPKEFSISNIDSESVKNYLVPSRVHNIMELMALTGEHMEKVYPADIEKKYDVKKREHLGAESVQRPIWYYTNTIMKILGVTELNMYIADVGNRIILENTNPPSLFISQALVDKLSENQLKFLITKYLFYVSQKQTLALKLSPEELNLHVKILASCFIDIGEQIPGSELLQKKMRGSFPRKVRKTLETTEGLWSGVETFNVVQYLKCLEYSSNRLGLLLSDSIELSTGMLYCLRKIRKNEEFKPHPQVKDIKGVDGVDDLLLFNMTEKYGTIRNICGIDI